MSDGSKGRLIVITGPSGVGKSTLCALLVERLGATLSISATTRPKGTGEIDGKNYIFLSREAFERKLADGEFLEHAEYLGNLYGTPAGPVRESLDRGQDVLLEIEVQGGMQVAEKCPDAVMIQVVPADQRALADRITGRGRDTPEVIDERLANAQREIALARDSGVYRHFVVNDVLEDAVSEIAGIVEQEREKRS
jgi:guanylate kinase